MIVRVPHLIDIEVMSVVRGFTTGQSIDSQRGPKFLARSRVCRQTPERAPTRRRPGDPANLF